MVGTGWDGAAATGRVADEGGMYAYIREYPHHFLQVLTEWRIFLSSYLAGCGSEAGGLHVTLKEMKQYSIAACCT